MQTKNGRIAKSQNNPASQVTVDGNDILLNADVQRGSAIVPTTGLSVDRSYVGKINERFYWDEAREAWSSPNAISFDQIQFTSMNQINVEVKGQDPFYIGDDTVNLGFDNNSIQSRGTSYSVGGSGDVNGFSAGALYINEAGGDVNIGNITRAAFNASAWNVNLNAGFAVNIESSVSLNIKGETVTTIGDTIKIGDENAILAEQNQIEFHGRVLHNGEEISNIYTSASIPQVATTRNLTQSDVWINPVNGDLHYWNGATWINVDDGGTYTGT